MKAKEDLPKTEEKWRVELSDEAFRILREKGTEAPHTGKYNLFFEEGKYQCAGCGQVLFDSKAKFDSHCGWPSFDKAQKESIKYVKDKSFGMFRTEVVCSHCEGHLGHVFNDGPTETGERYCINSESLHFLNKDK